MLTGVALVPQEGCDCVTVVEAMIKYGDPLDNYYVSCIGCPAKKACHISLDGYRQCWEKIAQCVPGTDEPVPVTKPDNVNHPVHYETGKFECIDVMVETQGKEAVKAYCLCAAFKYLYRHNRKNGLEDIKKARWYLDKYVELEEGEADG